MSENIVGIVDFFQEARGSLLDNNININIEVDREENVVKATFSCHRRYSSTKRLIGELGDGKVDKQIKRELSQAIRGIKTVVAKALSEGEEME